MDEVLEAALAPGVSVRDFFLKHVEKIHAARLEDFRRVSAIPVILSVYLTDTDERFTVELRDDGCEVEDEELVDYPVVTLIGEAAHWERTKVEVLKMAAALEARRGELEARVKAPVWTESARAEFERFDGLIRVKIVETGGEDVVIELVLNDYERGRGQTLEVTLPLPLLQGVTGGHIAPDAAGGQVRLGGHRALGAVLAGFWSKRLG